MGKLLAYWRDSKSYREQAIDPRIARNMRLTKGIPVEEESTRSQVTGKNKLYFRKIWSDCTRLLASAVQAYLMDQNKLRIVGRDEQQDYVKAKVLETMTKYRFNWMLRRRNLFVKLVTAIFNCITPGFSVILQTWKWNEEQGIDEPDLTVYPIEQVCLDWPELASGDPQRMRFAIFEDWMTMDQMEEEGYKNISKLTEELPPSSEPRDVRYTNTQDPYKGSSTSDGLNYSGGAVGHAYPERGSETPKANEYLRRFLVLKIFFKHKGKLYYTVINPDKQVDLLETVCSPYGKEYPLSIGHMLIDPHKPVPEGLPEVLEGPQESINLTVNLRKDNVLLAMNTRHVYSRFANVDKQSLRKSGPGVTIAADDVNGVKPLEVRDVTQSSYVEVAQYIGMMEEMDGVNPTKQGSSNTQKATVAQINLSEANAKHDLFIETIGQTLVRQFIYNLARHIQLFETDERIFRVANEALRQQGIAPKDHDNIYDLEFDFDLEVEAGLTEVGRNIRSQRIMAAMQSVQQSNNSVILALKSGIKIQNPKLYDLGAMQAELLPELGMPNLEKYLIPVEPPPAEAAAPGQPSSEGGEQSQVVEGQNAPQGNEEPELNPEFVDALSAQIGG